MQVLLTSTKAVPWRMDFTSQRFTYIGRGIEQMLGYPVANLTDLNVWASYIHQDDREGD